MLLFLLGSCLRAQEKEKVSLIFDSDMGPDYDDVGALAMLHALADKGEVDILATIASTRHENVVAALNIINTYFNRPEIPIGVPKNTGRELRDWQFWSDSLIQRYPHSIRHNEQVQGSVALYRKILSGEKDESVTIVTVGFLTNIEGLLKSGPDEHSPLSGKELVRKKVKMMVSMAGKFPEGMEFNIEEDAQAGVYVFENWDKPLIFSGFEIGEKILTGLPLIKNQSIRRSPIKDVYSISIPMAEEDSQGRMSWDQTAVLVAVRGTQPYYDLKQGRIVLNKDGYNTWDENGIGHKHLVEKMDPKKVEKIINDLMMHLPNN